MLRAIHSSAYSRMKVKQKGILYYTVASICGSSSDALVTKHQPLSFPRQMNSRIKPDSRLYFSSQRDGEGAYGFLSKVGSAVKSALPTKWFGSEEENLQLQRRKEVRQQVSGGLDEMLRDAPLGMRMMGKMISPLMSAAASTMSEAMAEQQRTTETVLEDARAYLSADGQVIEWMGNPIQIGMPFSQSSSSTIINGIKQTRVELAVPISGGNGSGVARILATEEGIAQLQVEAGGRVINVNLSAPPRPNQQYMSNYDDDDGIIEAEIVDKDTKYW